MNFNPKDEKTYVTKEEMDSIIESKIFGAFLEIGEPSYSRSIPQVQELIRRDYLENFTYHVKRGEKKYEVTLSIKEYDWSFSVIRPNKIDALREACYCFLLYLNSIDARQQEIMKRFADEVRYYQIDPYKPY